MTSDTLTNKQQGLTLIELLVALVISSVIALAAFSAIVVSRQGFATVDAASQLRDNARFATDIIQRLALQTGYQDVIYAATTRPASSTEPANVSGFTNGTPSISGILVTSTAKAASAVGYGSDVLVLRYQAPETYPGSGRVDKGIIDCMGRSKTNDTAIPIDRDDRLLSVLYVAESRGQPALMCRTGTAAGQPLVEGVENFQVLYGIDGDNDSVTDRYMRADQLIVSGNDVATKANWDMVRSIKIGLILRSSVGATQESASQTLYPFGNARSSASATMGSAFANATNDPGTVVSAPADRRLRLQTSFTIHLRNEQNL
ncbi:MAG: PilW family protein [Rhodoferax sp.]|uniref:PilW family protein n=1 Tax=Rhodoferax sp. TaxID=50421 RepID=UPI002ACD5E14|nr:PilW family protein [Rhodoferax sp.]MDZ7892005.1 PilW family protein [Rhodoferax sp.]